MARRLIDFTEDAALRPTLPPGLSYYYVRNLVAKHVGKDAAAMLSEPQAVPGEGRRQWLIDAPVSARSVRLQQLPPEEGETVRKSLAAVRQRVHDAYDTLWNKGDESSRQKANAISRAFEIPDDEANTWLVGDQTVLVGWGHVKAHARVLRPAELVVDLRPAVENSAGSKISTQDEPTRQGPQNIPVSPLASPFVNVSRAIPAIAALLWLTFITLASAAGWRLLEACSIEVLGKTIYASSSGVCKIPQNPLAYLLDQNYALVGALQSEQISLLSRPFCPAPPPPPRTLPDQRLSEGEQKAQARGANMNTPVQVTLEWYSTDDLDIKVECPNGRKIFYNNKEDCHGGKLDLDANAGTPYHGDPVEHIRWDARPPDGKYRLLVEAWQFRNSAAARYKVILRANGKVRECFGTIQQVKVPLNVIDFDPRKGLPNCNSESESRAR